MAVETMKAKAQNVWRAATELMDTFTRDPSAESLEVLESVHSTLDNAAAQLSCEISKRKHPAHYTQCHRCLDKGMLPRCPECHKHPDGYKLTAQGDGGIR